MKALFFIRWCLKTTSLATTSHSPPSHVSKASLSLRNDIEPPRCYGSGNGRRPVETKNVARQGAHRYRCPISLLRSTRPCRHACRHDAEFAALFQPRRALIAQQGAADLAGIVARAD